MSSKGSIPTGPLAFSTSQSQDQEKSDVEMYRMGLVIYVIAAPGSGSEELCVRLTTNYSMHHIHVGQLIQDYISSKEQYSEEMAERNQAYCGIPMEAIRYIVEKPIKRMHDLNPNTLYVFDSFPRYVDQIRDFSTMKRLGREPKREIINDGRHVPKKVDARTSHSSSDYIPKALSHDMRVPPIEPDLILSVICSEEKGRARYLEARGQDPRAEEKYLERLDQYQDLSQGYPAMMAMYEVGGKTAVEVSTDDGIDEALKALEAKLKASKYLASDAFHPDGKKY